MAKQVMGEAKFQVPGGQATPAPPVGTSLGKFGINLGQFVQQFNDRTKEYNGTPIPVIVTVYADRAFDFVTKSPPAASLLKQAAGIAKGSGVPNKEKVGQVESVLVEGFDVQENYIMTGRLASQAPDIDGQVILEKCEAEPGEIISMRISAAVDYDLVAEPITKPLELFE